MDALLMLGNQLFPDGCLKQFKEFPVFMVEDKGLCTHYKIHKQKILLFLSSMRTRRDELNSKGHTVHYVELTESEETYEKTLKILIAKNKVSTLHVFEIEDKFMEARIEKFASVHGVTLEVHPSPMFLCSRERFVDYLAESKKPFMKTFYQMQRRHLKILMDDDEPVGGKFSFDTENRKKIPKGHKVHPAFQKKLTAVDEEVSGLVEEYFPDHPGCLENFSFPTSRKESLQLLKYFREHLLDNFGPFQDAILSTDSFLYHSRVSTALNMGLLTPREVVDSICEQYYKKDKPLESVEGFVRQVIGWREFVRGIYQNYSQKMEESNFWKSKRKMKDCWYQGATGLPPVDDAIKRALQTGYGHHIERLMILANVMNLCEIKPAQVYQWFMEIYADSSDWVMAANVYSMGLMSDGGIFATKPYVSGSNYILKMSDYKKGPWCDAWDGLYWRFIQKHYDFFKENPRMRMMTSMLDKIPEERRARIFEAAEKFIDQVTD